MGSDDIYASYYANLSAWDCDYYEDPNMTRRAADLVEDEIEGENDWIIGVGFSILSTVLSCLGMILSKIAHNQQARLPDDKKYPEIAGIVCSPCWWGSFLVMGLIPFPADFIAFSYAAQSIVVPFAGLTIMLNQLLAPCILDEKLTKKDMIASVFIFSGCVVSTAFGTHDPDNKSICDLLNLFTEPGFFVALAFLILAVSAAIWNINSYASTIKVAKNAEALKAGDAKVVSEEEGVAKTEHIRPASCKADIAAEAERKESNRGSQQQKGRLEKLRPFSYGLVAGASGGIQNVCFKTAGMLMRKGFENREGVRSVWKGPYPYFFLVIVIFLAIQQITWLNKGLAQYDAVLALPLYNACYMILSTTYGGIYYKEFTNFSVTQSILFPFGILLTVAGILTLASGHENTSIEKNAEKQHEGEDAGRKSSGVSDAHAMKSPKVGSGKSLKYDDGAIEMTTTSSPEEVQLAVQ